MNGTLFTIAQAVEGWRIPDVWVGALLSLAVTGVTITCALLFQQREAVRRIDEYLFGDGRHQKGVAYELREVLPKMWAASDRVEDISKQQDEFEKRLVHRERQWEEFLLRQSRSSRVH